MKGIAYGVGVGPGDPELMSLKAVRLIRENRVIAVPGKSAEESLAYKIALAAVPELAGKELLPVPMPMTKDRDKLAKAHRKAADTIETVLDRGENVVYLTLGDPAVYCTFGYLRRILSTDGYVTQTVPGVTSFCAAAAKLQIPLAEGDEQLHILTGTTRNDSLPDFGGTVVLMKSAGHGRTAEAKEMLRESGRDVMAVENCGMENEKVYRSVEEIADDAGYFTIVIAK